MRTDAIKLTQKQQAMLRRRAVQLREKGRSNAEVARILSVHEKTVSGWWAAYGRIGAALFEPGQRGRRPGDQRRLTAEREQELQRLIAERPPDQLSLSFALWNRFAVGELIERKYGIILSIRTLGAYLRRWGYARPRPQKRAHERTDQAMQTWLAQTYPGILRGAKHESAQILWGDHIPLLRQATESITWSMMRAVTNRGAVRFLIHGGATDAAILLQFCGRLVISTEGRTVHLIVDHLPAHNARAFLQWTDEHRRQFTVFYLPAVGG